MRRVLFSLLNAARWRRRLACAAIAAGAITAAPAAMAAPPAFDLAALDRASAVSIETEIAPHADPGLDPQAVISGASPQPFAAPVARVPQYKWNAGDVWIRYRLTNSSSEPQAAKFVIHCSCLKGVDLFEVLPGGELRASTAGSATPVSGAAVATAYPTFQMMLGPAETRDYHVRIRSDYHLFFPMHIVSESRFSHAITRDTLVWSLIVGTALAFALHAASMSFGPSRGAHRATCASACRRRAIPSSHPAWSTRWSHRA